MKKRIAFALLALLMVLSAVACGAKEDPKTDSDFEVVDAADAINKVWERFGEEETFAVMGGDFANPVDGKAGKVDLSDTENVTATLHITEDALKKVSDAAALTHMMNANTFTCAAYRTDDTAALASSLKDSIKSTQWLCGFPDTLIIYTVGEEYVIAAFGNNEAIENFITHLGEIYGDSAVQNTKESLA